MLPWSSRHGVSANTICMNDDEILKTIDEMGDEYSFFKQLVKEHQQFASSVSEKMSHLKTAPQNKKPDIIDQIKKDLDQCKQSLKEMKQEIKGFDGNVLYFLQNIIDQYNKNYLSLKDLYGKLQKAVQRNTHCATNGNVVGVNHIKKVITIHHDNSNKCNECDRWMEKLTIIKNEKTELKTLVDQLLNELNTQNDLVQEYETNIDEMTNNHKQKINKLQADKTQLMDMFNKAKNNGASLTQKLTLIQQENDKLVTNELELLQRQLQHQTEIEKLTKEKNNYMEENNKLTILNKRYEEYKIDNSKLIDNNKELVHYNNKLQTERNELLQQLKMTDMRTKIYEEKIKMHNDIIGDNRINTDEQKRKIHELQRKYSNERNERILETNEYETNNHELEIENIEQKHVIEIMQIQSDIKEQDEDKEDDDDELKDLDNPYEKYVSYFALNYPIEASVFSYYALIVFITAIGFHEEDVCSIGDQIISWIAFILFLIIPTICEIYKWYLTKKRTSENNNICIRTLDICMKIFILGILMLTADLRPFKCYIDNEVALQIGVIIFGTFCFIVHVLITQINKKYKPLSQTDEEDEDEQNDIIQVTDHESE